MSEPDSTDNKAVHAPHPPLARYYGPPEQRSGWVRKIFDGTAADYDRIERLIGFGSGAWYRREALRRAGLAAGMKVLDVGVGTGLVASQAAALVGDAQLVTGLDPSPGMMGNARVPDGVRLVEGCAEDMPFADQTFDFLSMGFALRHIADVSVAFAEFHRVLKPGGRLCVLEITPPESRFHAALLRGYLRGVVPLVARLSSRNSDTPLLWSYYWDTIDTCVPAARVQHTLQLAGFAGVNRHLELKIFSEYRATRPA